MKKNYIAPNMDMMDFASEGIMQSLNVATGSGAHTISTGSEIE